MHISQKSLLPSFLYDLPVGHDKPLHVSLYQTESFQDNANYDKFHHPALCTFPLISLIRENRGGLVSAEGHVVWLNDAETATLNLRYFSLHSCDHLVSSVFFLILKLHKSVKNLGTKQSCQHRKLPNSHLSATVTSGKVSPCAYTVSICITKDRTTVWNVYSACKCQK